ALAPGQLPAGFGFARGRELALAPVFGEAHVAATLSRRESQDRQRASTPGEDASRPDAGCSAGSCEACARRICGGKGKSSSLRSHPHPALRATFSRFAGEGLIPNLSARVGKEALLPFTGEGARRADEGARAQRACF